MDNFLKDCRNAILTHLKEQGHLNVTEGCSGTIRQTKGTYDIYLRSLEGPPFVLRGRIKFDDTLVLCHRSEGPATASHRPESVLYEIDLADPALIEVIEKFVTEIKD